MKKKISSSIVREIRSKQAVTLLEEYPDLTIQDVASVFGVRSDTASKYVSRGMEIKNEIKEHGEGEDSDSLD